jgi:predicted DNA-binding transcriptional regulator AlpA
MPKQKDQAANVDALYETAREVARRLTTSIATVHRLIKAGVIPTRSPTGRCKIPKIWSGQFLASAYEIWPEERRPHYTAKELRMLSGIRVEHVGEQLGLGRSAAYAAVDRHEIPARRLPDSDRWVVPEDAAAQMEAYDLDNSRSAPLSEEARDPRPPGSDVTGTTTDDETGSEDINE